MPQYPPEQIYAAARALLTALDEERRRKAETLLAQAERGQRTDLDLLDLLTADEAIRAHLRDLLEGKAVLLASSDYNPLPGPPFPTPGELYICPVGGCEYRYITGEAGETPPLCPMHGVTLQRKEA